MYQSNAGVKSRQSSNVKSKTVKLKTLLKVVRSKMLNKYETDTNTYNKKTVTEIIYNEKSHIVARFKDFLIFDDLSEFLRRFYNSEESMTRIPKITDYYENYSKIFPNYINLPESKYVYKNIQRKQKLIDTQQRHENELKEKEKEKEKEKLSFKKKIDEDKIFNTDVYESIMNGTVLPTDGNLKINDNLKEIINDQSILSIEKLIGNINEAEKFEKTLKIESMDKNKKSIPEFTVKKSSDRNEKIEKNNRILLATSKTQKDAGTFSNILASPPVTQRQNNNQPKKILSPIVQKDSALIEKILIPRLDKSKLKTIEVNSRQTLISSQNSIFNKIISSNTQTHINEQIEKEKDKEKLNFESKLLHTKYKEIRNRNKVSAELSNVTNLKDKMKETLMSIGRSNQSNERKKSSSKTNKEEEKVLSIPFHKSNLSVPKLTNNIFYIINQNPHVNTQITIYNNMEQNKEDVSKINSLRESSSYKFKTKEMTTIAHQTPLTGRKVNNKVKTISQFKKEFPTSMSGKLNINQTGSVFKNTLGTINNDDSTQRKKYNNNPQSLEAADKKDFQNRNAKGSTTRGTSPLTQSAGAKNSSTINYINKSSLSPGIQAAIKNNYVSTKGVITGYNHKKTKSGNFFDIKSSINGVKPTQVKSTLNTGTKIFDSHKATINTKTTSSSKGIPIKNFNEVLKANSRGIANSERLHVSKIDKVGKFK